MSFDVRGATRASTLRGRPSKDSGDDANPAVCVDQKYHECMSNEELRELTASEPLTLEEEYDMQSE